ncbi:MAG: universal stress protein [Nitriliruptorales bacterium]|nr:universal stress protein [Nitriliruptorales bacterium]
MKIILGYVPTGEGRAALDAAAEEAEVHRATLLIIRAVDPSARDGFDSMTADAPLQERVDALRGQGLTVEVDVRKIPDGQSAGGTLVWAAQEEGADLIVIGHRRRSPVGKLLLGSDAQEVLLGADCPVADRQGDDGRPTRERAGRLSQRDPARHQLAAHVGRFPVERMDRRRAPSRLG